MFIRAVMIEARRDFLAPANVHIELQLVNGAPSRIGPPAEVLEFRLFQLLNSCRAVEELSELTAGDWPLSVFADGSSPFQNQRERKILQLQRADVRLAEIDSLL